ncbi:MAG: hypothetical protein AAF547_19475 [Actinomycetota bacterium]
MDRPGRYGRCIAPGTAPRSGPAIAHATTRPLRPAVAVVATVVALVAGGCSDASGGEEAATATEPQVTVTVPSTTSTVTSSSTTAESTTTTEPEPAPPCAEVTVASDGRIVSDQLVETSGLAASSGRSDGLVWATNDSGHPTALHGLGLDGADLGFFSVVDPSGDPVDAADVEDLAIHDGLVYLADIGDNGSRRERVTIWVVDEPDPDAGDSTAAAVARIDVTYPSGPRDAEAFLVDPVTGALLILDKDLEEDLTRIYEIEPPDLSGAAGGTEPGGELVVIEAAARLAGAVDAARIPDEVSELTASALLFPGAVTAADISTDGATVAVRTYGTVLLFDRPDGTSVAEILSTTEPCETGTAREGQGESLAFLPPGPDGSIRYVTASEGEFRPVNVVTVTPRP